MSGTNDLPLLGDEEIRGGGEFVKSFERIDEEKVHELPSLFHDMHRIVCPYMFKFVTTKKFEEIKKTLSENVMPKNEGSSTRQINCKINEIQGLLDSTENFIDVYSQDATREVDYSKRAKYLSNLFGKKNVVYLVLYCGTTYSPIVTYKVVNRMYNKKAKALAKVGAAMCTVGIKASVVFNTAGTIISAFGYPRINIDPDSIEHVKASLDKINTKESDLSNGFVNNQDSGLSTPEELEEFHDLLNELEKNNMMRQLGNETEKAKLRGKSWRDGFTKVLVRMKDGKKFITFVDKRLETSALGYAMHNDESFSLGRTIETIEEQTKTISEEKEQLCTLDINDINDIPKKSITADRLGYASYARGLVSVTKQAEGPNKSFCVGLDSPCGAGKSFLYKLIEGELKRDELVQERKKKEKDSSISILKTEFQTSYNKCDAYIKDNILPSESHNCCLRWPLIVANVLSNCILVVIIVPLHLFWAQKQKFSFLREKDIRFKFMNTMQSLRTFLFTSPFEDHMLKNIFSCMALLIPLRVLILIVFLLVVVAISCVIILRLIWLMILMVASLFQEPASDAMTKIINLIQIGRACNFLENDRYGQQKTRKKEADEAVKIVAILLSSCLALLCLWILLFIFSFVDYILKNTIVKLVSSLLSKYQKKNNPKSWSYISSDEEEFLLPSRNNGTMASYNAMNNSVIKSMQDESIAQRVRNILCGLGDEEIDLASPGLSKVIVKLYLNIANLFTKIIHFGNCENAQEEEEYEGGEGTETTKYVCVEFNAPAYNGLDHLWKFMLIEVWDGLGNVYGKVNLQGYRTGVELIRLQNRRGPIDAKLLYRQRQNALRSLNIGSIVFILMTSLTGIIIAINRFKPISKCSNAFLEVLYSNIVLHIGLAILVFNLIALARNIYTYTHYVLPTLQINVKILSKRENCFGVTDFQGSMKEEFEYILDFLRYAPLPKKYRKRYNSARLSILIDGLDRCESKSVMKTIQAVNLLLNDSPVTCWLAMDTRIVASSIERAMADQLSEAGMTGHDFIKKIIQLPFCIPDLDNNQKMNFIFHLFVQNKLDPVHLMNLVDKLVTQNPGLLAVLEGNSTSFVINNHSIGQETQEEERALRILVHRMKDIVQKSHAEQASFESILPFDSSRVIQIMEDAIVKNEWQNMDKCDRESFLFLVCEWIERFQDLSTSIIFQQHEAATPANTNDISIGRDETIDDISQGNGNSHVLEEQGREQPVTNTNTNNEEVSNTLNDEENQIDQGNNNPGIDEESESSASTSSANGNNEVLSQPQNEEENHIEQAGPFEIRSTILTKLSQPEKTQFRRYIHYMDGKAQTIIRIVNVYNLVRFLAYNNHELDRTDEFRKKLIKVIVLCEQWPCRMSWLLKITEDMTARSFLKDKEDEIERHPQEVFKKFDNLGLKVVRKKNRGSICSSGWNNDDRMSTTNDGVSASLPQQYRDVILESPFAGEKMPTGTGQNIEFPPVKDREKDFFESMEKLSLFETYHFIVENSQYTNDNTRHHLLRDGDPQLFKQLLLEDDCDLKLIDITMPNQFVKNLDLNRKYKSLRPYMINMYHHTIEKSARHMGRY